MMSFFNNQSLSMDVLQTSATIDHQGNADLLSDSNKSVTKGKKPWKDFPR